MSSLRHAFKMSRIDVWIASMAGVIDTWISTTSGLCFSKNEFTATWNLRGKQMIKIYMDGLLDLDYSKFLYATTSIVFNVNKKINCKIHQFLLMWRLQSHGQLIKPSILWLWLTVILVVWVILVLLNNLWKTTALDSTSLLCIANTKVNKQKSLKEELEWVHKSFGITWVH